MANILLIEPLQSVARRIMPWLLKDGHHYQWTISGQQGARMWLSGKLKFDVLLMNFETDDWNATEVLAELLGSDKVPQYAVIYLDRSATPATVADLAQEIAPLMPLGQITLLAKRDETFPARLHAALLNALTPKQEQEV